MSERTEIGVGVLARVVAILDAVEAGPAGAGELASALGLSQSTAYRLASEMGKHGLLRKDDDGRFHLGQRFVTTAMADLTVPVLRRVRDKTGESAQVWLRRGDFRLCAASVESQHELRATLPVGTLLPLPIGSAGHILAGDLDRDAEARERGWWVSVSERTPGLTSVSAPVRAHGEVVAAVCVAAPIGRIGDDPGPLFGPVVRDAALEIEKALPSR